MDQRSLDSAVISLMRNKKTVFLSCVAVNIRHTFGTEIALRTIDGTLVALPVTTAVTSSKRAVYNPDFFKSLSVPEQVFLVAHEVMHTVMKHALRVGTRKRDLFGRAADYEINAYLRNMGLTMPSMGLYSPDFDGMSAEEIYDILLARGEPNQPEDVHYVMCDDGTEMSDTPLTQEQLLVKEVELNTILTKAATVAKTMGISDGSGTGIAQIDALISNAKRPKLAPLRVLGNYISNTFGFSSFNHAKPHKRSTDAQYIPSRSKKRVKSLAFFMDASGSVEEYHFAAYMKAIEHSMRLLKPQKTVLYVFDRAIRASHVLKVPSDVRKIQFIGRGGTDIREVISTIKDKKFDLTIVFTDGDFRVPEHTPLKRVIWYLNDNPCRGQLPSTLGKTIHYSIDQ